MTDNERKAAMCEQPDYGVMVPEDARAIQLLTFIDGTGLMSNRAKLTIKRAIIHHNYWGTNFTLNDIYIQSKEWKRFIRFNNGIGACALRELRNALCSTIADWAIGRCAYCDTPFVKSVSKQKYCCIACGLIAYRVRSL